MALFWRKGFLEASTKLASAGRCPVKLLGAQLWNKIAPLL